MARQIKYAEHDKSHRVRCWYCNKTSGGVLHFDHKTSQFYCYSHNKALMLQREQDLVRYLQASLASDL